VASYEGPARVELFGHKLLFGRIAEVTQYGASVARVEVLAGDGVGPDGSPSVQYVGGDSIYRLTELDEATLERAVAEYRQYYAPTLRSLPGREQTCRVCGCSEFEGCDPDELGASCYWAEPDLCSRCVDAAEIEIKVASVCCMDCDAPLEPDEPVLRNDDGDRICVDCARLDGELDDEHGEDLDDQADDAADEEG
jgi:hypothetical protein